ncbi:MAG: hypothetical protein WB766_15295 [Roseiarcus sp.]
MGIMLGMLGDFFRNYGTPFATAVAIVNTVITVIISQFFQSNKRAEYVLVAASVFFGVIAIATSCADRPLLRRRSYAKLNPRL